MNLTNYIGKEVKAIGNCGIKKDIEVKGIYKGYDGFSHIVELNDRKILCSVNPNTIEL